MGEKRVEALIKKLDRGLNKSLKVFEALETQHWDGAISPEPDAWTVKQLVWHFISSEEALFKIAQDIASGGTGVPDGYDIDQFNQEEMERLPNLSPGEFNELLGNTRKNTIEWVSALEEPTLDKVGSHPVMGLSTVETVVYSIYAHQLMHMREVIPQLKGSGGG
jgi:hypothetical protein